MRKKVLQEIRQNIAEHGFHLNLVQAEATPRFVYSIGLNESLGFEYVFAGGAQYLAKDIATIFNSIARRKVINTDRTLKLANMGGFVMRPVDASWATVMLLGVLDYYGRSDIPSLQLVPDSEHTTVDVPNLSVPWSRDSEPVWRWLFEEWEYSVARDSMATTNLAALRGADITEAVRWEDDYWEMFAGPGPDVSSEDTRIVPIGTMIGADPTLERVLSLEIGEGVWRDSRAQPWNDWRKRPR